MGRNPTQIFPRKRKRPESGPLVSEGGEGETQEGRPWGPPAETQLSFLMEPPSCRPRMWGPGASQVEHPHGLPSAALPPPGQSSPVSVRD